MTCPICGRQGAISNAFDRIDSKGCRQIVRGKINAIDMPGNPGLVTPFENWYSVSVYLRRGRVVYLMFETEKDLGMWAFEPGQMVQVEGCLHEAFTKRWTYQLLFDVSVRSRA